MFWFPISYTTTDLKGNRGKNPEGTDWGRCPIPQILETGYIGHRLIGDSQILDSDDFRSCKFNFDKAEIQPGFRSPPVTQRHEHKILTPLTQSRFNNFTTYDHLIGYRVIGACD